MRKLIALAVLALAGFYAGWPAWSAYRIKSALEEGNQSAIAAKVDFPELRARLKPMVAAEVERQFDRNFKGDIATQVLGQGLKQQLGPQITEALLESFVTPDMLIRAYRHRGELRELIELVIAEQLAQRNRTEKGLEQLLGKLTRPPGPSATPQAPAPTPQADTAPNARIGLGNIKGFRFAGPLQLEFGFARNSAAAEPEVDVVMAFSGFDWRLAGVTPRLK